MLAIAMKTVLIRFFFPPPFLNGMEWQALPKYEYGVYPLVIARIIIL